MRSVCHLVRHFSTRPLLIPSAVISLAVMAANLAAEPSGRVVTGEGTCTISGVVTGRMAARQVEDPRTGDISTYRLREVALMSVQTPERLVAREPLRVVFNRAGTRQWSYRFVNVPAGRAYTVRAKPPFVGSTAILTCMPDRVHSANMHVRGLAGID